MIMEQSRSRNCSVPWPKLGYDGPVTAEPLGRCVGLIGRPPEEVALLVKAALDRCWPGVRR